jgi:hypothetical protein
MGYMAKDRKIISISTENWNILNERGKCSATFNDVLDQIMVEAGIKDKVRKLEDK